MDRDLVIAPNPIMPFGQFKGLRVSEVPTHYLRWLLHDVGLSRWLEEAIVRELEERRIQ